MLPRGGGLADGGAGPLVRRGRGFACPPKVTDPPGEPRRRSKEVEVQALAAELAGGKELHAKELALKDRSVGPLGGRGGVGLPLSHKTPPGYPALPPVSAGPPGSEHPRSSPLPSRGAGRWRRRRSSTRQRSGRASRSSSGCKRTSGTSPTASPPPTASPRSTLPHPHVTRWGESVCGGGLTVSHQIHQKQPE